MKTNSTHFFIRCSICLYFIFFACQGNAQEEYQSQTDSLFKILHIKSRITDTDDHWAVSIYKEEFFDTEGHLVTSFEYAKSFNNALKKHERYVYDTAGILIQKISKGIFNPGFDTKSVSLLRTLYQYDDAGKLLGEMTYDSTGRLRTQKICDYIKNTETWYFFDTANERVTNYYHLLDSHHCIYKSCSVLSKVDSVGRCTEWKNEYDEKGRLRKRASFAGKEKVMEIWYKYTKHGLLSSIERIGGSFSPSKIYFRYEYWK